MYMYFEMGIYMYMWENNLKMWRITATPNNWRITWQSSLRQGTKTRNRAEQNRTERNKRNSCVSSLRRDRTYFCLHVVLHRWYRNVHVATKLSIYSTEGMHYRTRLRTWKHSTRAHAFRPPQNQLRLDDFAVCAGVAKHTWLTKVHCRSCCLPSAQHYIRAQYGKSCVSSVSQCTYVALSSYCTLPLMCYTRSWILIKK